jgi:molybdopterin converting factor small subunit
MLLESSRGVFQQLVKRFPLALSRDEGVDVPAASLGRDSEQDRPLPKIRILVNGRDIGFLNGMETELRDGDEVLMLPLVGGG